MEFDLDLAYGLAAHDIARQADPLASFDWPSPKHRDVIEHFVNGDEVHHRAGNQGAKTRTWAAEFLALAQMRRELAGLRQPFFERPVALAVLVPSYKQAVDSSNKALFEWLGDWPCVPGWINKSERFLGMLNVKPMGWHSDNPETWSRILFVSQDEGNPKAVEGQRWDAVAGDEPPDERYWREARKNALLRIIAETPLYRSRYEWIKNDFDGCIGQVRDGRIEIVTSLYDNKFLPPEVKAKLIQSYKNDVLAKARIYGAYLNVEGDTPWTVDQQFRLQRWMEACVPGQRVKINLPGYERTLECSRWYPRDPLEQYILSADLSNGRLDPKKHDPARFDVLARKAGLHVFSWQGYADSRHVGRLAAIVGEHYNEAWIDFDATGGYGEGFMTGLADHRSRLLTHGYRKIVKAERAVRPGVVEPQYGYTVSEGVRAEVVSAVRGLLDMPEAEALRTLRTWDRGALDGLLSLRLVERPDGGLKIMSTGKDHDEPLFTLGRLLVLNRTLPWLPEEDERTATVREAFRKEFGRDILNGTMAAAGAENWPDNFGGA